MLKEEGKSTNRQYMHAITNTTTAATFTTVTNTTFSAPSPTSVEISCKFMSTKMKRVYKGAQKGISSIFWNGLPYQDETSGVS